MAVEKVAIEKEIEDAIAFVEEVESKSKKVGRLLNILKKVQDKHPADVAEAEAEV